MSILKEFIEVTFNLEGYHHWADAPSHLQYLSSDHRHIFNFAVVLQVNHNDREVEFHELIRNLQQWLNSKYNSNNLFPPCLSFGGMSCELIAKSIYNYIIQEYGHRGLSVKVSEDGENAGIVTNMVGIF